jgi:hypothetical protein
MKLFEEKKRKRKKKNPPKKKQKTFHFGFTQQPMYNHRSLLIEKFTRPYC